MNRIKTAVATATITGSVIVAALIGGPAQADATSDSCYGADVCQTASLYVGASHKMTLEADWKNTTCSMYDADNGNRVGQVSVPSSPGFTWWRKTTVGGLYGRYFAVCTNYTSDSAEGYLSQAN